MASSIKARPDESSTPMEKRSDEVPSPGVTSDRDSQRFAHLDEKKILRKVDIRIIPIVSMLYLLSFLDRGNISNAKIEGLQEDLNMKGHEYNWCLTVFFFTYAAFEVPSNILMKKLRPSRWLPGIMVAWGIVATLMGIVQNFSGLLAARVFLGLAEGGLFPGCAVSDAPRSTRPIC
jgi:sugar phosphate permease